MRLIIIAFFCLLTSACKTFYPNVMFKAPKDYEYADLDTVRAKEYLLGPDDQVEVSVFTNRGYSQVNVLIPAFAQEGGSAGQAIAFLVQRDGYVELPVVGRTKLSGLTVPEAQALLAEKYTEFYNDPLVLLKVINRRTYVFTGEANATVVLLENENTTLIEVLAAAGGVDFYGKAHHIKVVRNGEEGVKVDKIDLSTIDGVEKIGMRIEANDLIYVEPTRSLARGFGREFAAFITLVSSVLTLYLLILSFS